MIVPFTDATKWSRVPKSVKSATIINEIMWLKARRVSNRKRPAF